VVAEPPVAPAVASIGCDDHEVDARRPLHLQPASTPDPGRVGCGETLHHHALEAVRDRAAVERFGRRRVLWNQAAYGGETAPHLLEDRPPLAVGTGEERGVAHPE